MDFREFLKEGEYVPSIKDYVNTKTKIEAGKRVKVWYTNPKGDVFHVKYVGKSTKTAQAFINDFLKDSSDGVHVLGVTVSKF